jgi:hypothetical protein
MGKTSNRFHKSYWERRGHSEDESIKLANEAKEQRAILNPANKNSSPYNINFWINKGLSEEEAINKIKSFRKFNKEYWISRGFSEEDAIKEARNFQSGVSKIYHKKRKENPEDYDDIQPYHIKYWIKKGFTEEEASILVKERQTTFSLEKCILKYGLEEGTLVWKKRQDSWQETLKSKTQEELNLINKNKNSRIMRGSIDETIEYYKPLGIYLFKTVEDLIKNINNKIDNNFAIKFMPVEKFILERIPKIQVQILGLTVEELSEKINHLFRIEEYYENRGQKQAIRKYTNNGELLRSSYEILFYEEFISKFPQIKLSVDKKYPESNFRYDFLIDDKFFIEICPMYSQKSSLEYSKRIDYKVEIFGAIKLTSVKEIKRFIENFKELYVM